MYVLEDTGRAKKEERERVNRWWDNVMGMGNREWVNGAWNIGNRSYRRSIYGIWETIVKYTLHNNYFHELKYMYMYMYSHVDNVYVPFTFILYDIFRHHSIPVVDYKLVFTRYVALKYKIVKINNHHNNTVYMYKVCTLKERSTILLGSQAKLHVVTTENPLLFRKST